MIFYLLVYMKKHDLSQVKMTCNNNASIIFVFTVQVVIDNLTLSASDGL